MGTVEGSSPFDPLDGVSGRLGVASGAGVEEAALSGLPPRRGDGLTTPFSAELRRERGGKPSEVKLCQRLNDFQCK